MTLLVGCVSCVLALLLTGFSVRISVVGTRDARAQLAADAASLAAIAESGPAGGGDPVAAAARFAALNGATLVDCLCERGATAMQVAVAVDGAGARARAVIDVDALGPVNVGASTARLHPTLRKSVDVLVSRSRGLVHVVSGWRSSQEQAILWADALRRYGSAEVADDWVAPPGHSMHERGLAVDLGGDLELADRLARDLHLPLHRPLGNEPWHFELVGAR